MALWIEHAVVLLIVAGAAVWLVREGLRPFRPAGDRGAGCGCGSNGGCARMNDALARVPAPGKARVR